MHAFSGLRWWPACCCSRARRRSTAPPGTPCSTAATTAPACSRPGRAGARAAAGLGSGLGLAWRLQRPAFARLGGRPGRLRAGLRRDRRRRRRPGRRLGAQQAADAAGRRDVVDAFYATLIVMLALLASGVRDLLRAAAARRGGRRPARAAARHRACRARGGWSATSRSPSLGTVGRAGSAPGSGSAPTYALVTGDGGAVLRLSVGRGVVPARGAGAQRRRPAAVRRRAAGGPGRVAPAAAGVGGAAVRRGARRCPQWVQDLSPFEHLAFVPAETFRWAPFLAAARTGGAPECRGPAGLPRRDVH